MDWNEISYLLTNIAPKREQQQARYAKASVEVYRLQKKYGKVPTNPQVQKHLKAAKYNKWHSDYILRDTEEYYKRKNASAAKYRISEKGKAANKKYRDKHHEVLTEYAHKYAAANAERLQAYRQKHYAEHRKEKQQQAADYYIAHRDGIIEKARQYYQDNREKVCEYQRKNYAENREKLAARRKELYYANLEENRRKARERYAERKAKKAAENV